MKHEVRSFELRLKEYTSIMIELFVFCREENIWIKKWRIINTRRGWVDLIHVVRGRRNWKKSMMEEAQSIFLILNRIWLSIIQAGLVYIRRRRVQQSYSCHYQNNKKLLRIHFRQLWLCCLSFNRDANLHKKKQMTKTPQSRTIFEGINRGNPRNQQYEWSNKQRNRT